MNRQEGLMPTTREANVARVFAVVNAHSGHADPTRVIEVLRSRLASGGLGLDVHETRKDEDVAAVVRDAVARGFDLIVAAGGDGTVSAVANGVVGGVARLAILPLGTTNVLARELGVPLELEAACALIAGPNATTPVDGMRLEGRCYFTQIGVGVDAMMIHDTSEVDKRRMGVLAYVLTMLKALAGYTPRRITVDADGRCVRTRSLQVILANCGTLGASALRWGPDVRADDGRIDVCVFRPRSPLDYLRIAWNFLLGRHGRDPRLTYLRSSLRVVVPSDAELPVQGDGEVVARTPLEVEVIPGAIRVIVPPRTHDA
jgi:YegS/Rv2252/BmrU family lipid kinase